MHLGVNGQFVPMDWIIPLGTITPACGYWEAKDVLDDNEILQLLLTIQFGKFDLVQQDNFIFHQRNGTLPVYVHNTLVRCIKVVGIAKNTTTKPTFAANMKPDWMIVHKRHDFQTGGICEYYFYVKYINEN